MERFYHPKKDANGKTTYEPTWKREIPRFYCVNNIYIYIYIYFVGNNYIQSSTVITPTLRNKECILRRHPYFWKGMIEVQEDVRQQLKEGHKKLLKEVLHLSI